MFWNKKPQKSIRIRRIYDNVEMRPEYIDGPADEIEALSEDIQEYPERYAWDRKQQDGLAKSPAMTINIIDPPEDDVICEIVYTYETILTPPATSPITKLIIFIIITSALGLIGMLFWYQKAAEMEQIDTACYYYMKNGTPESIILDGEEFRLEPDGSVNPIQKVFLNPDTKERMRTLHDSDCTFINLK